jgi:hypothetical protein
VAKIDAEGLFRGGLGGWMIIKKVGIPGWLTRSAKSGYQKNFNFFKKSIDF